MNTYINSVASSFPKYKFHQIQEYGKIDFKLKKIKGATQEAIDFSEKIINGGGIDYRYTVHPVWKHYDEMVHGTPFEDDIFLRNGFNPSLNERLAVWASEAPKLCLDASIKAIENSNIDKEKITDVIIVSTSGWSEPGIASFLIKKLGLNAHCKKLEILFNGCFAGMTGLRSVKDIISSDENRVALLVAVEVCSSHYSLSEEKDKIIANTLFSDGAAAVIMSHMPNARKNSFDMSNFGNCIVNNTSSLMRWGHSEYPEVQEYSIFLSEEVPSKLYNFLSSDTMKSILDNNLTNKSFKVVCHPGGKAILHVVKKFFQKNYNLGSDTMAESFNVLKNSGNIASVSILLVLEEVLNNSLVQEELFLIACGPGITIEWGKMNLNTVPN